MKHGLDCRVARDTCVVCCVHYPLFNTTSYWQQNIQAWVTWKCYETWGGRWGFCGPQRRNCTEQNCIVQYCTTVLYNTIIVQNCTKLMGWWLGWQVGAAKNDVTDVSDVLNVQNVIFCCKPNLAINSTFCIICVSSNCKMWPEIIFVAEDVPLQKGWHFSYRNVYSTTAVCSSLQHSTGMLFCIWLIHLPTHLWLKRWSKYMHTTYVVWKM